MKRIITIADDTGLVSGQLWLDETQEIAPEAGRTHVTLKAGDTGDYSGTRWNGTAFEVSTGATVAPEKAVVKRAKASSASTR